MNHGNSNEGRGASVKSFLNFQTFVHLWWGQLDLFGVVDAPEFLEVRMKLRHAILGSVRPREEAHTHRHVVLHAERYTCEFKPKSK